jgi:hypothetical protein
MTSSTLVLSVDRAHWWLTIAATQLITAEGARIVLSSLHTKGMQATRVLSLLACVLLLSPVFAHNFNVLRGVLLGDWGGQQDVSIASEVTTALIAFIGSLDYSHSIGRSCFHGKNGRVDNGSIRGIYPFFWR